MRHTSVVLLGFLLVFLAGCGSAKPKDLIVGKWEAQNDEAKKMGGMTVEFKPESAMTMKIGTVSIDGKYKFVDDATVEVETEMLGKKDSKKFKVEIVKDEMTTTELDGAKEVSKFKKVK
ncbi:MAG: hypothetical protein JNM56_24020 [Planctomycetia bacterium]|nr:hypothetical protein [Planctomycetia bacterium]